jgi:hypothetical protein
MGSGIGVPGMSYVLRFLVLGLALPLVIWLLFNGPDLKASANLFFFGIIVLKFYWLIWGRVLFAMFGGDRFTYGGLALGCFLLHDFTLADGWPTVAAVVAGAHLVGGVSVGLDALEHGHSLDDFAPCQSFAQGFGAQNV